MYFHIGKSAARTSRLSNSEDELEFEFLVACTIRVRESFEFFNHLFFLKKICYINPLHFKLIFLPVMQTYAYTRQYITREYIYKKDDKTNNR